MLLDPLVFAFEGSPRREPTEETKRLVKLNMREAVQEEVQLTEHTWLVPVYHPGSNGSLSRTDDEQKVDWQRVKKYL